MYHATVSLHDQVQKAPDKLTKIKALVVTSPKDELVNERGVLSWLEKNKLPWKHVQVRPKAKVNFLGKHLIIDSRSLGDSEWERLSKEIENWGKECLEISPNGL